MTLPINVAITPVLVNENIACCSFLGRYT